MSRKFQLAAAAIAIAAAPAFSATNKAKSPSSMTNTPVHAAMALHVNPGLWEVTVTPNMKGDLPLSDDELAKIPADRRAKFMAAMRGMIGTPHKMRECMTREKLNKGFTIGRNDPNCTESVVSNTANAMEVQATCTGSSDGMQSMDVKFMASSPTSVAGTTHVVAARHGRSMTVDSTLAGQWLSSNCGSVKDVEVEQ